MHQLTVNNLNGTGSEIIKQSTAPDATLLSEKLDSLNQRWRHVCAEVTDRRDR